MIEVLFKYLSIFIIAFNFIYSLDDATYNSQEHLVNNYTPLYLSKNNIGIKIININNLYEKYLSTHNWITENLYLGGLLRSENSEDIKIFYSLNVGYKSNNKLLNTFNIIYDFSYFNKRLTENYRWKKFSILFSTNNLSLSYNYLFNNDVNSNYINFEFFNKLQETFILNIGIKKYENFISPYVGFKYIL